MLLLHGLYLQPRECRRAHGLNLGRYLSPGTISQMCQLGRRLIQPLSKGGSKTILFGWTVLPGHGG